MRQFKISSSITDRNDDSLGRYLRDISRIPMVSPADELMLARRIKAGDKAAEHRLINANLRFVVSCAKKYTRLGVSLADLISEGNIGLLKAARTYDDTKGFKFISYAVWWVRQQMVNSLLLHSRSVRLPANQQEDMRMINAEAARLEQVLEREPNLEELAEVTGKTPKQLTSCIEINAKGVNLEDTIPGGESEDNTRYNLIASADGNLVDEIVSREAVAFGVLGLMNALKQREREILIYSFGLFGHERLEQDEVATKLGLSKERVRQLKCQALQKLREIPAVNRLKEFA